MPSVPHPSSGVPDLILVNPAAGGGLAEQTVPGLRMFAAKEQWKVEIRSAESAAEFTRMAREAAAEGRPRIFALGGDGTFQLLLNAAAGSPLVTLGVLPAGGGNDLASALGLPPEPILAAKLILSEGEVSWLDAAVVRTADGVERLYMGGGGVGLDAEAMRYAGGVYRNIRGRTRYLLSAIRALRTFQPLKIRLFVEGSSTRFFEYTALVAAVLNTPSYGAGLRLAPSASLEDGALDLVTLEELNMPEILRLLPALALRGELRTDRAQRFAVTRVRIETDRPSFFQADGELIGQTPAEIAVVPRAAQVWHLRRSPSPKLNG